MSSFLFVGAEVDERGGQDRQCWHVERERHVVRLRLLGERPLVVDAQAKSAVLRWKADAGETAVPQLALQLAIPLAATFFPHGVDGTFVTGHVLCEPSPGTAPK